MTEGAKRNLACGLGLLGCVLTAPGMRGAMGFILYLRIIPLSAFIWALVVCSGLILGVCLLRITSQGFSRKAVSILLVINVLLGLLYDYKTAQIQTGVQEYSFPPMPGSPQTPPLVHVRPTFEPAAKLMGMGEYLHFSVMQTSFVNRGRPGNFVKGAGFEEAIGLMGYVLALFQLIALAAGGWVIIWKMEKFISNNRRRERARAEYGGGSRRRNR